MAQECRMRRRGAGAEWSKKYTPKIGERRIARTRTWDVASSAKEQRRVKLLHHVLKFRGSRDATACGQPMPNSERLKLNSRNLAGIILHHSVHVGNGYHTFSLHDRS